LHVKVIIHGQEETTALANAVHMVNVYTASDLRRMILNYDRTTVLPTSAFGTG